MNERKNARENCLRDGILWYCYGSSVMVFTLPWYEVHGSVANEGRELVFTICICHFTLPFFIYLLLLHSILLLPFSLSYDLSITDGRLRYQACYSMYNTCYLLTDVS
ncbi:hypothetical protein F5Y11DRAFT_331118 [Daldinia sp. FL1419]|nr:hypothetical protein F5Y11DRAFT_331118 [Daldinia sp. FL1419]